MENATMKAFWGGMEGYFVNVERVWSPWGNDQVLVNNGWLAMMSGPSTVSLELSTEWYKPESRSEICVYDKGQGYRWRWEDVYIWRN